MTTYSWSGFAQLDIHTDAKDDMRRAVQAAGGLVFNVRHRGDGANIVRLFAASSPEEAVERETTLYSEFTNPPKFVVEAVEQYECPYDYYHCVFVPSSAVNLPTVGRTVQRG